MTNQKHFPPNCIINKKTEIPYLHKYTDPLLWDSKLSSGASCIHRSSLRCFYNLIGVHLWSIQLIEHDLERHTFVYIRSHRWQGTSEQKVRKNKGPTSIILKWKKFGTTKTLPRAVRLAKLSNRGEGPWSGRWSRTQWSLWQSSRFPLWIWEMLPEGQTSLQECPPQ